MRVGEPARQVAGGSVVPGGRAAEGAARGGLRESGASPAAPHHRAWGRHPPHAARTFPSSAGEGPSASRSPRTQRVRARPTGQRGASSGLHKRHPALGWDKTKTKTKQTNYFDYSYNCTMLMDLYRIITNKKKNCFDNGINWTIFMDYVYIELLFKK